MSSSIGEERRIIESSEIDVEDMLVEEEEGMEGLDLRAGGDTSINGEVAEELLDLSGCHISGMAFVVEADVASDPADVAFFGAVGVVTDKKDLTNLVEQTRRPGQGEFTEVDVEDVAIEEVEGMATGGEGADGIPVGLSDGLEELADFGNSHVAWMTFAVEEDEATGSVSEGGDGGFGMAEVASDLTEQVEEARLGRGMVIRECPPIRGM